MIFQIAAGVCLGILAAGIIWKNWRALYTASTAILIWGVILACLAWAGMWLWEHSQKLLAVLGVLFVAILLVGVMYGVPFAAYAGLMHRLPQLGPLVRGDAPWNQWRRAPLRLTVMALIAISVAVAGIGFLLLVVWTLGKFGILT